MTSVMEVFDPSTAAWSQAAPMLAPRGGSSGSTIHQAFAPPVACDS
ncbi:MAG TPA: kelch repeat-containing protein [Chloroflexota bacterium]|nr:kelch repeat-containing protein [Chloroflexota bacterium]